MAKQDKNVQSIYPLSPVQQGMLFHTLLAPKSGVYFNQVLYTLTGSLDGAAFHLAWQQVVDRHEPLRTLFVWEGQEKPLQVVRRQVALPWKEFDWRGLSAEEQIARLTALLKADRELGFNLSHAPLMRMALIRMEENRYELIWSHHHLLIDGWSSFLILKDVMAIYQAVKEAGECRLESSRPYRTYVNWLRQQDLSKAEEFWRPVLKGFTEPTPLLGNRVDHSLAVQDHETAQQLNNLSSSLLEALRSFAGRHDLTLSTLVQGAWAMLLSRYSGEEDIVYGSTVSGRSADLPGIESMVGLFINTLPVRARFSSQDVVLHWLKDLQNHLVELRQYEHSPLVEVQGWSDVRRDRPLFESMLAFENYPVDASVWGQDGSMQISNMRVVGPTNYPLSVVVVPGDELLVKVTYDSHKFEDAAVSRMLGHFGAVLEGIVANPAQRWSELPLLTSAERHQLLMEWNRTEIDYGRPECLKELFEAQAERTPEAVAAVFEDQKLSYRQLNEHAKRLAQHLQDQGVGPNILVGICLERSLEMLVALLGILKAGGAYVPLDPAYPNDRLAFMLEDCQPRVLLTQKSLQKRLPPLRAQVLCLDALVAEKPHNEDRQLRQNACQPSDLVYVLYTSGSTGKPKGVQISNRALVNFLSAMQREPGLDASDTLLAVTTLSFDIAGLELLLPLISGARVVIASGEVVADGERLSSLLERCGATVMQATPPTWRLLLAAGWTGSRGLKILCGGEAWPAGLADELLPRCKSLWNMYGPTETTIWSSVARVEADKPVVIGFPIANTTFYILDQCRELVPVGVPGELYIGGDGVAEGYFNRPDLTAERFVSDPFSGKPGAKLYRTGDVVRRLSDGKIEFLHRIDHQVKIRGFRIELGEIEDALQQHPALHEAVVTVREDTPGDKRLVAYYIGRDAGEQGEAAVAAEALRKHLARSLPEYMVPAAYMKLEALPLTPNGKLDRKALPAPEANAFALRVYEAPQGEVETILAGIWAIVLKVERIGRHDNFFELGGHSLTATQVVSRICSGLRIDVPLRNFFERPTVASFSEYIEAIQWTSVKSTSAVIVLDANRTEVEL